METKEILRINNNDINYSRITNENLLDIKRRLKEYGTMEDGPWKGTFLFHIKLMCIAYGFKLEEIKQIT